MGEDLNKLRDRACRCAREHGFHDKDNSDEYFIALVMTELAEAIDADRKGKHADIVGFNRSQNDSKPIDKKDYNECFKFDFECYIKGSVEEEMADIIIRLLDLAGLRGIDVSLPINTLNPVRGFFFEGYDFAYSSYILVGLLHPDRYILRKPLKHVILKSIFFVFLWSEYLGFDLFQHIYWKMKYNEFRPMLNGKKY